MKKKLILFGDSFAEGETFAKYLSKNYKVTNLAVSGSTVGEYTIYPVFNSSLLSRLNDNVKSVRKADVIMLEYGINDAAALAANYTDIDKVLIDLAKAYDFIKQNNDAADIVFVLPTHTTSGLGSYALTYAKYVSAYVRNVCRYRLTSTILMAQEWDRQYHRFEDIVLGLFKARNVLYMIDSLFEFRKYIGADTIHPTREGHKEIYTNLIKQLKERGQENGNKRFQ